MEKGNVRRKGLGAGKDLVNKEPGHTIAFPRDRERERRNAVYILCLFSSFFLLCVE